MKSRRDAIGHLLQNKAVVDWLITASSGSYSCHLNFYFYSTTHYGKCSKPSFHLHETKDNERQSLNTKLYQMPRSADDKLERTPTQAPYRLWNGRLRG